MSNIGPQLPTGLKNLKFEENNTTEDVYGPCLPPSLKKSADENLEVMEKTIGPSKPSNQSNRKYPPEVTETCHIGPSLPSHVVAEMNKNDSDNTRDQPYAGPSLPPHLRSRLGECTEDSDTNEKSPFSQSIGPELPSRLARIETTYTAVSDSDVYGPALPPELTSSCHSSQDDDKDDDDGDIIGPMPSTGNEEYSAAEEFERRAQLMKDKLSGKGEEKAPVRESWMMELPSSTVSAQLGLQARSFRSKAAPSVDSSWTETPADRERKRKEKQEGKSHSREKVQTSTRNTQRDKEIEAQVASYNKSRKESLLAIHQKDRKVQKELDDDGQPPKRRAFDRELDLKVNRFDEAQRKNVIKKSEQLNTRFSHGSSKFI